jgi:hypothetical protein
MKKMIFLNFVLSWFLIIPAIGQNESVDSLYAASDTLMEDFLSFSNDNVLKISLRFDITQYTRKKSKDDYLDAIMTYHLSDTDSINKDIRLKSRGEFRNGYCDFPPISLNFKKSSPKESDAVQPGEKPVGKTKDSNSNEIGKIKLVTHCKYGNEEYLFKEYLIYKLFNVLSDSSFRVKLLNIEYINTSKKSKPIRTYGFIIEPVDFLAKRLNSVDVNSTTLTQKNIIPEMMDRLAIFNYMIGNTDWSVPNLHNCKVLSSLSLGNASLGLIVPYDFDYSGLVNADYAIPYEGLGLSSVRERRYVGICRTEEVFINALKEFSDKKTEFYKVINDFTLLNEKERKVMIQYLDSFYSGFDKRNSVVSEILSGCSRF